MTSRFDRYSVINRRGVVSVIAGSIAGISGCTGVSASNPSQSVLIRNETTTQYTVDLILKNNNKNSEVVYESTFTVDPNEQIRQEDVVSVGDYEYIVESDGLESKNGIWIPDSTHESNTIVIDLKKYQKSLLIHVVTVSH